ncbi:phage holin family protein [Leclercia pneumoniae]|uniref:Phage holin family protein n=2 Tax=Leclercia pneumoniae TaxID=2815358 RepID=A0ABX8K2L5_9ENTR|nr:hypothetical protein JZ655_11685 [Leclercia pneumoniae]QWW81286.1 phage holin family protein [Leclercia pneumoniae]
MSEPLSGSATAHAAVTTATFAGFWANTEAGVILGALAGALIYVLTSHNLSAIERGLFGVVSFIRCAGRDWCNECRRRSHKPRFGK